MFHQPDRSCLRLMIPDIPGQVNTALLDALLELKGQSRAMQPDDAREINIHTVVYCQAARATASRYISPMASGRSRFGFAALVGGLDGRSWLRTRPGKHWLQAQEAEDWLQTWVRQI